MHRITWDEVMTFVRFSPHLGLDWLNEEPQGSLPDSGYLYRRFQCNNLIDADGLHVGIGDIRITDPQALKGLRQRYSDLVNDPFMYGDGDDDDCEAVHDKFGPQYIFLDLLCDIVEARI